MSLFQLSLKMHGDHIIHGDKSLFSSPGLPHLHDGLRGRVLSERAELGPVMFGRVRSTGHDVTLTEDHSATLLVALSGHIEIKILADQYRIPQGGAVLVPTGLRTTRVLPHKGLRYAAYAIAMPVSHLVRAAMAANVSTLIVQGQLAAVHPIPPEQFGGSALSNLIGMIAGLLENPTPSMSQPSHLIHWAALLIDSIIDLLFPPDLRNDAISGPVARAIAFMNEQVAQPPSVAQIAAASGISLRMLEKEFKSQTGRSPQQYFLGLRYDAARQRILAVSEPSVSSIAASCGFQHMGRFSTGYSLRFGKQPSAELHEAQLLGVNKAAD